MENNAVQDDGGGSGLGSTNRDVSARSGDSVCTDILLGIQDFDNMAWFKALVAGLEIPLPRDSMGSLSLTFADAGPVEGGILEERNHPPPATAHDDLDACSFDSNVEALSLCTDLQALHPEVAQRIPADTLEFEFPSRITHSQESHPDLKDTHPSVTCGQRNILDLKDLPPNTPDKPYPAIPIETTAAACQEDVSFDLKDPPAQGISIDETLDSDNLSEDAENALQAAAAASANGTAEPNRKTNARGSAHQNTPQKKVLNLFPRPQPAPNAAAGSNASRKRGARNQNAVRKGTKAARLSNGPDADPITHNTGDQPFVRAAENTAGLETSTAGFEPQDPGIAAGLMCAAPGHIGIENEAETLDASEHDCRKPAATHPAGTLDPGKQQDSGARKQAVSTPRSGRADGGDSQTNHGSSGGARKEREVEEKYRLDKDKKARLQQVAQEIHFFISNGSDPVEGSAAVSRVRAALFKLLRDPAISEWTDKAVMDCFKKHFQKSFLGFYKISRYTKVEPNNPKNKKLKLFDPATLTPGPIWDAFLKFESTLRELKARFPEMKCFLNHEKDLPKDSLGAISRVTKALQRFFPRERVDTWGHDKLREMFRRRYEDPFAEFTKKYVLKEAYFVDSNEMNPDLIWDLFVKWKKGKRINIKKPKPKPKT